MNPLPCPTFFCQWSSLTFAWLYTLLSSEGLKRGRGSFSQSLGGWLRCRYGWSSQDRCFCSHLENLWASGSALLWWAVFEGRVSTFRVILYRVKAEQAGPSMQLSSPLYHQQGGHGNSVSSLQYLMRGCPSGGSLQNQPWNPASPLAQGWGLGLLFWALRG